MSPGSREREREREERERERECVCVCVYRKEGLCGLYNRGCGYAVSRLRRESVGVMHAGRV